MVEILPLSTSLNFKPLGTLKKQRVLKLNGTHQLLVYIDDVNLLAIYINTIRNKELSSGLTHTNAIKTKNCSLLGGDSM
jgi:hypothetical protein